MQSSQCITLWLLAFAVNSQYPHPMPQSTAPIATLIKEIDTALNIPEAWKVFSVFRASEAAKELVRRGANGLREVRDHLMRRFENGTPKNGIDQNAWFGWILVLDSFLGNNPKLVELRPYPTTVQFRDHEVAVWLEACENALRATEA